MKYAIILGSTRSGRAGEAVARWTEGVAREREASYELVDLASYDLGLLDADTIPAAANRDYADDKTRAWGQKIDEFDGYIFVTPEYNHSVPAALKNAFDVIYPEWADKAVGFVAYGADGGVRAVEHWRNIVANAHLIAVRAQVSLQLFGSEFSEQGFSPNERRPDELNTLLDQVERLATALKPLRN